MAKQTGLGDRLLLDGYDLSGDVGAIDEISGGPALIDVTHLDKSAMERIGGLYDGSIAWSAWFNPGTADVYEAAYPAVFRSGTGAAHQVLSTLPTTDRIVTYLRGTGLGSPGAGLVAKQLGYDGKRGNDGALTFAVAAHSSAGLPLEWGVQGADGLRTDTTATNGASVDNSAATSAGLAAYLHIIAFTGTSVTVKVQHSTDNSAWADLLSFTAATGVGAERGQVTGTVNRYLRVITSGTFTSATIAVLVCRG